MIESSNLSSKKILKKIGDASYFVYLCHCLFIIVATYELRSINVSDIGMLLLVRAAVGYILTFVLYYLYKLCKTGIKAGIKTATK